MLDARPADVSPVARLSEPAEPQANVHLLATCYFRSDQAYRAYHLLQSAPAAWPLFLSLWGLYSLTCSCLHGTFAVRNTVSWHKLMVLNL